MTPKMIWANLPVTDLDRTTKFYTALGFKPNGTPNAELTSFMVGAADFVIHFFMEDKLRSAICGEIADAHKASEVLFSLSAASKDEVNQWAQVVKRAGGNVISRPETFGAGYYGFVFADPDGHRFNVFYMDGF